MDHDAAPAELADTERQLLTSTRPLWAITLAVFLVIMSETLPAGLLPEIAGSLGTTESAAGQLVSVYALGTVLTAIPAVALTRTLPRRRLLLAAVAVFLVANALTALTVAYPVAVAGRFVAGACSGLVWGIVPGFASRIVDEGFRGRAITVVMLGTPLALSVGTPLGTYVGSVVGWRWSFLALSLASVVAIVWIRLVVPETAGQRREAQIPVHRVLWVPGLWPIVAVVLGWMIAHNGLYTFVAPFLRSHGAPFGADTALLVFGLSALVGIAVTGALLDRAPRALVLASLAGFVVALVVLALAGNSGSALVAGIVLWGLTFGGAGPQLTRALAEAAGDQADVAQSGMATVWNGAIFVGGAAGGVLLHLTGAGALPWLALVLVVAALATAAIARRHAFPPVAAS